MYSLSQSSSRKGKWFFQGEIFAGLVEIFFTVSVLYSEIEVVCQLCHQPLINLIKKTPFIHKMKIRHSRYYHFQTSISLSSILIYPFSSLKPPRIKGDVQLRNGGEKGRFRPYFSAAIFFSSFKSNFGRTEQRKSHSLLSLLFLLVLLLLLLYWAQRSE